MEFRDFYKLVDKVTKYEELLKEENYRCETPEKKKDKKKRQNGNFAGIVHSKIWTISRSRMTKWTSPLNSSREI